MCLIYELAIVCLLTAGFASVDALIWIVVDWVLNDDAETGE